MRPRDSTPSYVVSLGVDDTDAWLHAVGLTTLLPDWRQGRPVRARSLWPDNPAIADAWVARSPEALALATGPRARAHARRAARARARDRDVFFTAHIDLAQLRRAIPARTLRQSLSELDPIDRALVEGILALLGHYESTVAVTPRGLVIDSALALD